MSNKRSIFRAFKKYFQYDFYVVPRPHNSFKINKKLFKKKTLPDIIQEIATSSIFSEENLKFNQEDIEELAKRILTCKKSKTIY